MHRPALFALTFLVATSAGAREDFPNQIPNGTVGDCMTCHSADPPAEANLNVFGDQMHDIGLAPGHQSVIWANAYDADADGDGCTNGYELGDPEGTWMPGDSAGDILGNPAIADCTPPGDGDGDGDGDGEVDGGACADGACSPDGGAVRGDGDTDAGDGDTDGGPDAMPGGCSHAGAPAAAPTGTIAMVLLVGLLGRRRRSRR